MISQPGFVCQRHLRGNGPPSLFFTDLIALHNPPQAHSFIRINNHDLTDAVLPASLKEQGNFRQNQRRALLRRLLEHCLLSQGMQQAIHLLAQGRIGKDGLAQPGTVQLASSEKSTPQSLPQSQPAGHVWLKQRTADLINIEQRPAD